MIIQHKTKYNIPKHFWVVASSWVSRIIVVILQVASVRILISGLGIDQYSVFVLLISLSGWYVLSDMGIGTSTQNYISESRPLENAQECYIFAAGALAIILIILTIVLLYCISPYIAPLFLKQFTFLSDEDKSNLYITVGALLAINNISGTIYKIWYALQKGYWSNIAQSIAAILGFAGVMFVEQKTDSNNLYWSVMAYITPQAVIPFISLCYRFTSTLNKIHGLRIDYFVKILRRAIHFWFFGLMAAIVLQIDYIVMSQFMTPMDITTYQIAVKVFGLAFFVYQAVLMAIWPIFTEAIVKKDWRLVKNKLNSILITGISFMALSTILLIWLMPTAFNLLSPNQQLKLPVELILLFGIYYIVRIWSDTFSMVLQSMSDLKPFWIYVPIQAFICVLLQWELTPHYGLYGIVLGLLTSFLLTVSWALPLAVHRHYELSTSIRL